MVPYSIDARVTTPGMVRSIIQTGLETAKLLLQDRNGKSRWLRLFKGFINIVVPISKQRMFKTKP